MRLQVEKGLGIPGHPVYDVERCTCRRLISNDFDAEGRCTGIVNITY